MDEYTNNIDLSLEYIKSVTDKVPEIALILGSGLGDLADQIENPTIIKYQDIPGFMTSDVEGHKNQLVIGSLCGKCVLVMQGRFHYYEGYTQKEITYPIRIFKKMGINKLLVTNAAGGVNKTYKPGDLMIIKDHINFSGSNPLIGKNDPIGPRFPDMSNGYHKEGRSLIKECADRISMDIKEGVYMYFSGPNYETPAEVRMARILGADAVGMSTVPEVLVANHCGMSVHGISCITNMAAGILDKPLVHDEVIETSNLVKDRFIRLVKELVKSI